MHEYTSRAIVQQTAKALLHGPLQAVFLVEGDLVNYALGEKEYALIIKESILIGVVAGLLQGLPFFFLERLVFMQRPSCQKTLWLMYGVICLTISACIFNAVHLIPKLMMSQAVGMACTLSGGWLVLNYIGQRSNVTYPAQAGAQELRITTAQSTPEQLAVSQVPSSMGLFAAPSEAGSSQTPQVDSLSAQSSLALSPV